MRAQKRHIERAAKHTGLTRDASSEDTVIESIVNSARDGKNCARTIEERAHELLSEHMHFRGRASSFEYEFCEEVLIVRGRVPSFYLKQVLQTALKELGGVACIDNRVDVISGHGISSVYRRIDLPAGESTVIRPQMLI